MKSILFYIVLTSIVLGFTSCAPCKRFFTYETKTINIKGITTKLKKAGIEVVDVGVGEIIIKSEFVKASERLQELDLRQWTSCNQLKNLPKNSPLRNKLLEANNFVYNEMFKIALNPESVSSLDQVPIIIDDSKTPHKVPTKNLKQKEEELKKFIIPSLLLELEKLLKDEKENGPSNNKNKIIIKQFEKVKNRYMELRSIYKQLKNNSEIPKIDEILLIYNKEILRRQKKSE